MEEVLTEGDFRFNDNLKYLKNGLIQGTLCRQGFQVYETSFYFDKKRLYDFTRSAKALIREAMTTHLVKELGQPELQAPLRAAFNSPYNYWNYKLGTTDESLRMLIFVCNYGGQFVADVIFKSKAFLPNPYYTDHTQYAVAVTLVCHRYTYFQPWDDLSTEMGQLQLKWWRWRSTRIVNEQNVCYKLTKLTVQTCSLIVKPRTQGTLALFTWHCPRNELSYGRWWGQTLRESWLS